jgi:eukaryotic-like serine/threonine-protein kinase
MVASIHPAMYVPFLVAIGLAAIAAAVYATMKGGRRVGEKKVERLLQKNMLEEAVTYLTGKSRHAEAARLLLKRGQAARAADIWQQAGDLKAAAAAAVEAGQTRRAAELFQRSGDLASAAGCYMAEKMFDEALILFRKVNDLPMAVRLLERAGQYRLALLTSLETNQYDRVATLALDHVDDVELLKRAADYLEGHSEGQLAIPIYRKGNHYLELGRTAEKLGLLDEALSAYEHHDYFEDAARVCAAKEERTRAARLYLKAGNFNQAIEQLVAGDDRLAAARLLRRIGNSSRALDILSGIARDSDQFKDGTLLASSILEEHHQFGEAVNKLGDLLDVLGYSNETLQVLYRTVDLQIHVGDIKGAVERLERAKRSGVDTPSIDEQLMLLRDQPGDYLAEPPATQRAPLPSRAAQSSTTTIGFPQSDRYALKRKLARGGHGVLFLVHDHKLGQEVVLKLLHSESLPSALARKYFLREAKTAAVLDHGNIVRVFDYGELHGRPYIAMEYVDGLNLLELQDPPAKPLTLQQKLHVCLQLCEALEYAHEKTIIHRDIKMENVMVTRRWQVKLMDFGLAKALDENPDRSLLIVGTPYYMSPEQIVGDYLDSRTDIYSLGVLMYRLFTGQLPFDADAGEILSAHRFVPPKDPREHLPDLPMPIAVTILKCLEKNPERRFQQASHVAAQLKPLLVRSNG